MIVRPETERDHEAIREVDVVAVQGHPYSRQTEHLIVEALRAADALEVSGAPWSRPASTRCARTAPAGVTWPETRPCTAASASGSVRARPGTGAGRERALSRDGRGDADRRGGVSSCIRGRDVGPATKPGVIGPRPGVVGDGARRGRRRPRATDAGERVGLTRRALGVSLGRVQAATRSRASR